MTDREAFKIGFMLKCAEAGLTDAETRECAVKAAVLCKLAEGEAAWWNPIREGVNTVSDIASKGWQGLKAVATAPADALPYAGTYAGMALIPAGLGGLLTGYMLSNAGGADYDTKDAQRDEELSEYYRAIDQLRRSQGIRREMH